MPLHLIRKLESFTHLSVLDRQALEARVLGLHR